MFLSEDLARKLGPANQPTLCNLDASDVQGPGTRLIIMVDWVCLKFNDVNVNVCTGDDFLKEGSRSDTSVV